MRLSTLLTLPSLLLSQVYAAAVTDIPTPNAPTKPLSSYNEHLTLHPLPPTSGVSASLYAGFSFTSTTSLSDYRNGHYKYFPRALAQILKYTRTTELHLRFSLGRWDDEVWGARPRGGRREGGNGVEIWAWIEGEGKVDGDGGKVVEERWSDLVNSLSGLFCASLNFIDAAKTVRPLLSFAPEGDLEAFSAAGRADSTGQQGSQHQSASGTAQLRHAILPHEVVCTENLTPFLKLLPCKGKAGISSLLDGHKLFDANWQAMSIDVRPVCTPSTNSSLVPLLGQDCHIEIQQTVDMVLDIERSSRPRDDPIPRTPLAKDLVCDESKHYHSEDTCYPLPLNAAGREQAWSLTSLFGRAIKGSCPLAEAGRYDIKLDVPGEREVRVLSSDVEAAAQEGRKFYASAGSGGAEARFYRLPTTNVDADFDLQLPVQVLNGSGAVTYNGKFHDPPVIVTRHLTGPGASKGILHTTFTNLTPRTQRVVYLETLPWFLRPYIHTLHLTNGGKVQKMFYTPLRDRERSTTLELLLELPPGEKVEMTYEVEKAILRYAEYPPDANRGFDIPAAVVRVLPPGSTSTDPIGTGGIGDGGYARDDGSTYLRTTSLLLPLPTPDFSMPYNVIILTSTVLALGFGSLFNLLVRRFVFAGEVPEGGLVRVVRGLRGRVGWWVARLRAARQAGKGAWSQEDEQNGVVKVNGRSAGRESNDGGVRVNGATANAGMRERKKDR